MDKEQQNSNGKLTRKQRDYWFKIGFKAYKDHPIVDSFKKYVYETISGSKTGIHEQVCMIEGWKHARSKFELSLKKIDKFTKGIFT